MSETAAATAPSSDLVAQLRARLEQASELTRGLEQSLRDVEERGRERSPSEKQERDERDERVADLERRLATAESDVKELASRLVDSEHQAGRLMNLYVATFQLHATLRPEEVQETIAEIAINLLGAEQFVLLLRRDDVGDECEIALRQGIRDLPASAFGGDAYRGGDPVIDATLRDGVLRLGPSPESAVLAAVPLRVQEEIVGALVLLKLFDHKPILRSEDRDLLDLLSAHAASALFAARLFATKDRKLRTLESLVKLARGE